MGYEKKEKSLLFRLFQSAAAKNKQEAAPLEDTEQVIIPELVEREQEPLPEESSAVPEEANEEGIEESGGASEDREHTPEDIMEASHNYLEALRCGITLEDLKAFEESGREHLAYFSDFTYGVKEPEENKKAFLRELQETARAILEARKFRVEELEAWKTDTEQGDGGEVPELEPVNAHVCVKIPDDRMEAWIFAFPPENGGKEITEDLVINALNECKIVYGVDDAMVKRIVYQLIYLKLVNIAVGTEPVDGVDGIITDHFSRMERNSFVGADSEEDESVDFKNLDWLHAISEGEVICDIVAPVESIDGHTVTGEIVKGRLVEKLVIPSGTNTVMNEDRTALLSKINGTLYFENGKFHVKDVMNIMSDVDLTVGNINTIGNLDIKGDVLSGFRVRATGDINIRGMVGNSVIIAGGNIRVNMGVRGCGDALIECGGKLDCVYIENSTVRSHGAINAGSIINSDVISDDEVICKKIVGGNVTALNRISANVIGNNQHRQAVFNLGITQQTLHDRTRLEEREKELEQEYAKVIKDLRFLKSKKRLSDREQVQLEQLLEKSKELETETEEIKEALESIRVQISEFSECELKAQSLFPPVTVTIRSDAVVIEEEKSMCRIWSENGEIRMT